MSLSRRQFLRGAAGTAVALPLLSSLGSRARAVPPSFPKRLVVFYSPHGTVKKDWIVTGSENDFTLSGILAPLEPHKKDLLVLKNIDLLSAEYGPADTHQEAMSALLTGYGTIADPSGSGGRRMDTSEPVGWGGGISVDQFLAGSLGAMTKLPSLELGVVSTFNEVGGRIIYSAPGTPVPPVNDPAMIYDRIFADLALDPATLAAIRRERKSVLDVVQKQFARVQNAVSKEDRDKLQAHADAIRGIELRLDAPGGVLGGACTKPARPDIDFNKIELYPDIGKLQMDLLVLALACDVTRIASIMWSHAGFTSPPSPWLGIEEGHHTLSHTGDSDVDAQTKLSKVKTWYAQQFAYLIAALKAVPEGAGSMLDNTVVWWGSELSVGNTHSHHDMPFVLAGSCGGYFKTGRFIDYGRDASDLGHTHNDLLVSLCHAMGRTDVGAFGNVKYCTGAPLPKLTG